ncbi:MAG: hypothetical protein HY899_16900 [Deltaproteobacteria bacterium]|nr:hypothetical protein [Deltaproteobacteria bacterium]
MQTPIRLALVFAITALLGAAAVPSSDATQADTSAPAAQAAAKYVLHVDGMT